MGAGILPCAKVRGNLFFLFGKETTDGKWSDFGGSPEKNETIFQTAIREGTEELNGFLGSHSELTKHVKEHVLLDIESDTYTTIIFEIDYDLNLPLYFNNNHNFIKKQIPNELTKENGLFEKSKIAWFSLQEIQKHRYCFRPFYKKILDKLIEHSNEIKQNMRPTK